MKSICGLDTGTLGEFQKPFQLMREGRARDHQVALWTANEKVKLGQTSFSGSVGYGRTENTALFNYN